MSTVEIANKILSFGAIISHVFIVVLIVYFVFFRKTKHYIIEFISKHGILFAFIVSLTGMLSSLFYSEFAGFQPCELCWFQRIFMYPLVFLLALALIKKPAHNASGIVDAGGDSKIVDYALLLAVLGGLVSLYHNYMYYFNGGLNVFCQLGGTQVSCIKRYVFEFGYVTIPLMALTGFLLIITFLVFYKLQNKKIN